MYGLDTQRVSLPAILPSVENEEDIEPAGDLDISDGPEDSSHVKKIGMFIAIALQRQLL
jgi:hypothetical protein